MGIKKKDLGRHLLVDFFGVRESVLRDKRRLMANLHGALARNGFHIIRSQGVHQFQSGGRGVTGFVLLAQSHAAFHSYPEFGYLALDIYSCGSHDPRPVARQLQRMLKPRRVRQFLRQRGFKAPLGV